MLYKMNFLKVMDILDVTKMNYVQGCQTTIEERIWWMEDREPESEGVMHDNWEEKYDTLNDIYEIFDNLIEEYQTESPNINNISKLITKAQEAVDDFQCLYGGLSRLSVMIDK